MKTIVGLFDHFSQAEAVVRELEAGGYDRRTVSIVATESARGRGHATTITTATDAADRTAEGAGTGAVIGGVTGGMAGLVASLAGLAIPGIGPVLGVGPLIAALTGAGVGAVAGGLIGALTTAGVPEQHARYYEEGVRRGGTLVTVSASDADADRVMEVMNRHNPVDIEERASRWRATSAISATGATGTSASPTGAQQTTAVSDAAAADFDQAFREGTIEVTERVEQPVVQKQARVVEEVVVGKEATERTETVRDTVRKTDLQVEQVGAVAADSDRFDNDFRANFQESFPGGQYTYEQVKPVYRYGQTLASEHGGSDWNAVEADARRRWEERNPGTWDRFKDAARYAWDRARDKV